MIRTMLSYAPPLSIRSPNLMGLELTPLQISVSTDIRLMISLLLFFF